MNAIILQLTHALNTRPEVSVPNGIRLRNFAGDQDVACWLDLRHRAFARQRLGVSGWSEGDFCREFLDKPWWRPDHCWIAETTHGARQDSQAVGTVTLAFRGAGALTRPAVHWLAVLPDWRRRGLGRALIATLEARCWDLGYRQVWLETHSAWQAAVEMYRDLGYVPAETAEPH